MMLHAFVKQFEFGEPVGKLSQLRARWQSAPDEQERDFNEGGFLGQFLNGNAAIPQNSFFAVNESDGASAGPSVAVAFVECDATGVTAQLRDVDAAFLFRSFHDGELESFSVEF